ncbi:MAG TPA: hypothetical protein VGT08_02975 [Terracidiphilus sp.]|nr:hypothetical protein [Terracidiphilus sp.]
MQNTLICSISRNCDFSELLVGNWGEPLKGDIFPMAQLLFSVTVFSKRCFSLVRNGNIMRRAKNITVAVTERAYFEARVYAAKHRMSVSGCVEFILANLPLLSQAVRNLVAEAPTSAPIPLAHPTKGGSSTPSPGKSDPNSVKK